MPLGFVSLLPMLVTAAAAPLLLKAAPSGEPRRLVAGALGAFLLAEAGLYLLFWSTLACWLLVGAAACALAVAAFPRRPWTAALAALAPSVALGLAFETTGGDVGLLVYVASSAPLLLVAGLAALLSRWLRWDARPSSALLALTVLLFAALVPFTSFWPSFLLTFEPVHLPFVVAALLALGAFARWGAPAAARERADELASETWGDLAARPLPWPKAARTLPLAAGLFAAATAAAGLAGAPPDAPLLVAAGLVALVAAAWSAAALRRVLREEGSLDLLGAPALAAAASALLAGQAALDLHLRDAPGAAARLGAASLALALSGVGLLLAGARARGHAARRLAERTALPREDKMLGLLPRGALVEEGSARTAPDELERFRARVAAAGAPVGVLVSRAPGDDPLWTLPEDAYEWLLRQDPSGPRVHVALVEGGEASLVPPVVEVDA